MQLLTTNDVRTAKGFVSKRNKTAPAVEWVSESHFPALALKAEKSCAPSPPVGALEATLAESRRLLELPPNWDDDGADVILETTWERAADFLRKTARKIAHERRFIFPIPELKPCSDGSIDLHWKNELFELLINIPPVSRGAGDFYGESKDGLTIKGSFQPEIHHQGIVCWLLSNG